MRSSKQGTEPVRRVLLRTLLLSSGSGNILRYEKDKKVKRKARANRIGIFLLALTLVLVCGAMAAGYGILGLADAIPPTFALMISAVEFILCVLRINGDLFAPGSEMLIALPIPVRSIVSAKVLCIYLRHLPYVMAASVSMLIGYAVFAHPVWVAYPVWILLTIFLPLIPMAAACVIGTLIGAAGSRFRHKNVVQAILTFILVIFCFCLRFIIQSLFENGRAAQTMQTMSNGVRNIGGIYLPVRWFGDAVHAGSVSGMLLLTGVSLGCFELVFALIARHYRSILSRLQISAAHGTYHMRAMKQHSPVEAVARKEAKTFFGSVVYLTNFGLGQLLALMLSVAVLFIDVDGALVALANGAPLEKTILLPVIPAVLYFLICMTSTGSVSWSLEGKQMWIPQSLPITKAQLIRGKIRFQLWISIPFMLIGCVCFGIAFRAGALLTGLYVLCGAVLCLFSALYGMLCGVRHEKLHWEKEVEVVKQSGAIMLYLFPNMLLATALVVGGIIGGMMMGVVPVLLLMTLLAGVLAGLCHLGLKRMIKRK